ncbi:hypothetical protein ACLB2K_046861 [Fragaria x ananassa]
MAAGDQHHLVAARRHFSRRISWFGPEPVIRPECSLPAPPPPPVPSLASSPSPSHGAAPSPPAARSSATSLSLSNGPGSPSPAARECMCLHMSNRRVRLSSPLPQKWRYESLQAVLDGTYRYMVATGIYGCMNPEGLKNGKIGWLIHLMSDRWFVVVLRHYVKAIYYVALGVLLWMLANYSANPVIEFVSTREIRERPELEWVHTQVLTFGDIIHRH